MFASQSMLIIRLGEWGHLRRPVFFLAVATSGVGFLIVHDISVSVFL